MVSYASCGKYDFSATGNCQNTERFAIALHHPYANIYGIKSAFRTSLREKGDSSGNNSLGS